MITPEQIQKILDFMNEPIDPDGEVELLSDGEVHDIVYDMLESLIVNSQNQNQNEIKTNQTIF